MPPEDQMAEGMSFYNDLANGPDRRQRADRLTRQQATFFGSSRPSAHGILDHLLAKYATGIHEPCSIPRQF